MKQLIICEKSSVAKAVAIALGVKMKGGLPYASDDRIIDAAKGHLLGLAEPNAYDSRFLEWRAGDLPIVPDEFRSEPRDEDDARLNRLLDLIRSPEVGEVVNACDAAREGELIFKLIYQAAEVDKPVRRAWFSSLTPGAIRRAFEKLRDDADMKGLEDEALARDIGDWLVGINGTRAVTVAAEGDGGPELRKKAVAVGRVQTPTLRILVEREREIDEYVPEPYYRVMGVLGAGGASSGSTVEALLVDGEDAPFRFPTEAEARAVADEVAGRLAVVQGWEAGNEEKRAPLPFDLATLQVEASRAFGWSADRTLREAQRLYEMQFISYPRTDSRFLTWDLKGQIKDALERVPDALPELGPVAEGLRKAADEEALPGRPFNPALVRDHHAIIPTGTFDASKLTEHQLRLYELVVRRFVAAFMPPSVEEHYRLRVTVGERRFFVRAFRVVEEGWRAVEPGRPPTDPAVLEAVRALGEAGEGTLHRTEVEERHPWRPRPHDDGSLIRAMEWAGEPEEQPGSGEEDEEEEEGGNGEEEVRERRPKGIGTPATRSSMIETLIRRRYARRQGRWIYATIRGRRLIELLEDLEVASPQLTAEWEERLEAIREGRDTRAAFEADLKELVGRLVTEILDRPMERLDGPPEVVGDCPLCEGQILERDRAFGCDSWKSAEEPGCGWTVFRERANGRIGRAEAEWRIRNNQPHKSGRDGPLAPGQAAVEDMPDEMVPYQEAELDLDALGDPGDPEGREAWAEAIQEVVEAEGPVMVRRILRVLQESVEGARGGRGRKAVNRISAALLREGALLEVDDLREPGGQQDRVVRVADQPEVEMRERGPRDPMEIPRREIRAVWEALGSPEGVTAVARAFAVEEGELTEEYRSWFEAAIG